MQEWGYEPRCNDQVTNTKLSISSRKFILSLLQI